MLHFMSRFEVRAGQGITSSALATHMTSCVWSVCFGCLNIHAKYALCDVHFGDSFVMVALSENGITEYIFYSYAI